MTKRDRRSRRTVRMRPGPVRSDADVVTAATGGLAAALTEMHGPAVTVTANSPGGGQVGGGTGSSRTGIGHAAGWSGSQVNGQVWLPPDEGAAPVAWQLECDCGGGPDCAHIADALTAIPQATGDGPGEEPHPSRLSLTDLAADVPFGAEHTPVVVADVASDAVAETHMTRSVENAVARFRGGERRPINYMTADATGGLATPDTNRRFGIELEYIWRRGTNRAVATAEMGAQMFREGLTTTPRQRRYGAARRDGYRSPLWSFEADGSVHGELVSPVSQDTQETWERLEALCRIMREHGARPHPRAGLHVHVSTPDWDHGLDRHTSLVRAMMRYEDLLYRVGQNTWRRHHRRSGYARPVGPADGPPPGGYTRLAELRNIHRYSSVNLAHMRATDNDRAEFRLWDSTLRPEEIQAQVNLSLGLAAAAGRRVDWDGDRRPIGWHRDNSPDDHGDVIGLGTALYESAEQREQLAGLYAMTTWENRTARRNRVPYSQEPYGY